MSTQEWNKGLTLDLDIDHSKKVIRFDWTDWINEVVPDTISSSVIDNTSDITITGKVETGTTVTLAVEASGSAVVGDKARITCIITTTAGQSEPRTIYFNLVSNL